MGDWGLLLFIPIKGVGILVFAPPLRMGNNEDRPDMSQAVAFIVDGSKGLVIERGAWHNPGFALTASLEFILTVRKNTADDVHIVMVDKATVTLLGEQAPGSPRWRPAAADPALYRSP